LQNDVQQQNNIQYLTRQMENDKVQYNDITNNLNKPIQEEQNKSLKEKQDM
jgi:nitrogen fixation protein FixH